jgi:hypothetical protein
MIVITMDLQIQVVLNTRTQPLNQEGRKLFMTYISFKMMRKNRVNLKFL